MTIVSRGRPAVVETAGGGGFGDPRDRTAASAQADVADGKVSVAVAAQVDVRKELMLAD